MRIWTFLWMAAIGVVIAGGLRAEAPALLVKAVSQWDAGRKDLAFTQHAKTLDDNGGEKKTWVERYDPSLPDNQRWKLIELNGKAPGEAERAKWEKKKNDRPRKKAVKSLAEYLDLEHAKVLEENAGSTRFEIGLRPEAARLVAVDKLSVIVTVDKEQGDITHIAALLREPMKIALGLAKVTDVDFDIHIDSDADEKKEGEAGGDVKAGSTAKVVLSKFGDPVEYRWSDFKRVTAYGS